MKLPYYQVDAFTANVFCGNPAGVCPLDNWLENSVLQNIAAENNLSETAFFVEKNGIFELRWFTPKTEVDLCGHATLASAFVVFNVLGHKNDIIDFHTKSGVLVVHNQNELLSMDFPSRKGEEVEVDKTLEKGIGKQIREIYKSRDYLVILDSEEEVKDIKPDFNELTKLDCVGIIVSAKGKEVDFVSRFFAPRVGVPEDPVTGSAHCTLIPYWAKRLNKKELIAHQISGRGGELYCKDLGARVSIAGKAALYLEGYIYI